MDIICKIRDIYKLIGEFEGQFYKEYGITLNEGQHFVHYLRREHFPQQNLLKILA